MSQKDYKLNVLITTYNHGKYIKEALDGALMQETSFPFNIIVHDDASTDNTQEIIIEYAKRYPDKIITILQNENIYSRGISRFPYIIEHLTGEYIAYCEGDDYWTDPNKLQKQVDCLDNNGNYVGCGHNVRVIDENYDIVPENKHPYKRFESYTYIREHAELYKLPAQLASLVIRNIWVKIDAKTFELYENCKVNGDQKLALLLTQFGDIYCFEDVMADHRKIVNEGDSWSARTYGKNLTLVHYKSRLEMKKFSFLAFGRDIDNKTQRKRIYANSLMKVIRKPNKNNRRILNEINKIRQESLIELYTFFAIWLLSYPVRRLIRIINKQ